MSRRVRQATTDDEHKAQERAYADAHAEAYIHEMHEGPWPIYRSRMEDRLFAHMPQPKRVFDMGCGPLPSLPRVYERAERYVASDQSEECLRRFQGGFPRCEVVHADAESLPVEGQFDLVMVLGVLHHLPHPEKAVANAFRLLAPGGLVIAMEPNEDTEMCMDSPNEKGIPNREFDALYADFETVERWAVFDWRYWRQVLSILTTDEVASRWPVRDQWVGVIANEDEFIAQQGGGSMNMLIGRKPFNQRG